MFQYKAIRSLWYDCISHLSAIKNADFDGVKAKVVYQVHTMQLVLSRKKDWVLKTPRLGSSSYFIGYFEILVEIFYFAISYAL